MSTYAIHEDDSSIDWRATQLGLLRGTIGSASDQGPAVSQATPQSPTRLVPLSQEDARLFSEEGWEVLNYHPVEKS